LTMTRSKTEWDVYDRYPGASGLGDK